MGQSEKGGLVLGFNLAGSMICCNNLCSYDGTLLTERVVHSPNLGESLDNVVTIKNGHSKTQNATNCRETTLFISCLFVVI